jgi:hypothetical protein
VGAARPRSARPRNRKTRSTDRTSYTELRERTEQVEAQSQEAVKLNQQLEQRVNDQVGEIERMSRLATIGAVLLLLVVRLFRAAKPENGIVRLIGFRCKRLITIAVSASIYDALMFKKSFSPLQTF